jgi:hypothetical protein
MYIMTPSYVDDIIILTSPEDNSNEKTAIFKMRLLPVNRTHAKISTNKLTGIR